MAEFNTGHIVSLQNASRFFSGALVNFCHISMNFFTRLANFFQNLSDVCYVNLSSNKVLRNSRNLGLNELRNLPLLLEAVEERLNFLQFKYDVKS